MTRVLRAEWFEAGTSAALKHEDLLAFLVAKWGVAETTRLTSDQLNEDIGFFRGLAGLQPVRINTKEPS